LVFHSSTIAMMHGPINIRSISNLLTCNHVCVTSLSYAFLATVDTEVDQYPFKGTSSLSGRGLANSNYQLRHVCPCVHSSAWNNSAPNGRIFMKIYVRVFFEELSRKFKFH